jgi:DNA-directed RNA polymerase
VADSVTASVKQDSLKGTEDSLTPEGHMLEGTKTLAAQWLTFGITRKTTKRSVMTLAYGSKKYGFKEQIMEDHLRPAKKRLGDSFPFTGDGYAAASYMAGKIWDSLDGTVAAAKVAMADLQAMVPVTNSNPITWETPSGFSVEQCYPETEEEKIQLSFNGYLKVTKYLTDSVRLTKTPATWNTPADFTVEQAYEKEDNKTVKLGVGGDTTRLMLSLSKETGEVDVRKQAQGIAPNFVHSMDASHLMFTVCKANDSGIKSFAMIHDSFGTHAADTASLFVIVRDQFVEMYQTDVLADFHHNIALSVQDRPELLDKLPERPKVGNLDLEKVRTSAYCFA